MNRLFLDIETSPLVVYSWSTGYNISLSYDNIIEERKVICVCWSWNNEPKVHSATWSKNQCDRKLLDKIVKEMDRADEIVGHNIDKFDLPWIKTRCAYHSISTLPKYPTIDTLVQARKHFRFNSNRLDYLGKFLGFEGKEKVEFKLWKDVMLACPDALDAMVKYCKRDVSGLLRPVYNRLTNMFPHKTHVGALSDSPNWTCAKCGSDKVKLSKTRVSAIGAKKYQMNCFKCGGYYSVSQKAKDAYDKRR